MDEYISREALLAEIAADYGKWIACNDTDELYRQGVTDNYSDTIRLINDIPTADVISSAKVKELQSQIADLKRCIKSLNSDYLTGYISALSAVERMITKTLGV